MKKIFVLIAAMLLLSCAVFSQQDRAGNGSAEKDSKSFGEKIDRLMQKADVPGMSIAVVRNGRIAWTGAFGVRNSAEGGPVTEHTIFEAASLTKPVAAYAVFKLVDQGKLDIDKPLNEYLGNHYDVGDDERLKLITARRVLSHTSGFPNWRNRNSKVLAINFTPGERFSYSGEGFVYLAKVVEKITGKEFGEFVEETVFGPLGMNSSSLDWQEEYFETKVFGHDSLLEPKGQNADVKVNAAASLHTTSNDYARFVIAVLEGKGISKSSHDLMLKPQIPVNETTEPELFWGLGWGLQVMPEGKSFWHWGDNGYSRAFVMSFINSRDAVVFFANGANGLSFLTEILEETIGGRHPSVKWLDYERYDSPSRTLFKSLAGGKGEAALEAYREKRKENPDWNIAERQMNRLGYNLLRMQRFTDAILVFTQNSRDFPDSANTWDSLAEAYMASGNRELAIKYYKKSLAMDPSNKNAAEKIKELAADPKPDN